MIDRPIEALVPLYPWQQRGVTNPARFTHSRRARQTGKSFELALKADLRALGGWKVGRPPRDQILLSASELQSVELIEKCAMHLQAMQVTFEVADDQFFEGTLFKRREIRLPTGRKIIGLAANPRTARGFTGDVYLDEFAMHKDDEEIWAALFPIVTRGDLCLDVYSTPKGKKNVFYRLETNGQFGHSLLTIYDAVAQGLQVDIESIREAIGDDETFRQEYLCEYVDEATAFNPYELIQSVEDAAIPPPARTEGEIDAVLTALAAAPSVGPLYHGMDVGRKRDLTVHWLKARVGQTLRTVVVLVQAAAPFRRQRDVLTACLRLPDLRSSAIDATGLGAQLAEEAADEFGGLVEPVIFTAASKAMLAYRHHASMTDRLIRIPVDPKIRESFHAIRKVTTGAGNIRFDAERTDDGHADEYWASTLAVYAASEDRSGPAAWQMGPQREVLSVGGLL